ncbi:glycoside hydrolase family 88 protein [Paenibacillus sp. FSL R7-0337]|uniref:glycoside hydrolase family 88/105 protein n=1 Tax=Paenibacillus sp. FSL R7-0337 TaxID=1926588 RepID=UPI00096D04B7|nr:glycoside hydrolase family 88 protein [Paenibacillus sp. FSL R7-0337]OMF98070.1 glycosyl hydrolase [Paenibacillus sp. FSL R7-0337]
MTIKRELENRQALEQKLERIWEYMRSERHQGNWAMDIDHWDWVPGVGVISLLEYGTATDKQEVTDYLLHWVNRNKLKAEGVRVINSLAPYALFPELYRLSGDPWLLSQAQEVAAWMLETAPRTREGALEHTVTEAVEFPEQVWADTVYMAVLFLARLAGQTGDRELAAAAVQQTLLHLRLLQDPETGLLFHGWNSRAGSHMSAARWARANAWVALAVPEIVAGTASLTVIPQELCSRYRRLASALRQAQGASGLWHTVLDQPDYYEETSASAGIACGFLKAVKSGLLEDAYLECVEAALAGILPLILVDGEVQGVSGGTPVMPSIAAYNTIERYPALYGQGLVMQLLTEALNAGHTKEYEGHRERQEHEERQERQGRQEDQGRQEHSERQGGQQRQEDQQRQAQSEGLGSLNVEGEAGG